MPAICSILTASVMPWLLLAVLVYDVLLIAVLAVLWRHRSEVAAFLRRCFAADAPFGGHGASEERLRGHGAAPRRALGGLFP